MEVQNAGLGEGILRDLNDEINKLVREKRHWEIRIRDLGGRDYTKMTSSEPGEDSYSHGIVYRYYGAAKNLPGFFGFCSCRHLYFVSSFSLSHLILSFFKKIGKTGVKELLASRDAEQREREQIKKFKRTRAELYRGLDCNYYGFRDDEDGVLEILEAEAESKARKMLVEKALSNRSTNGAQSSESESTSTADVGKNHHVDDQATKETNEAALMTDTLKINPSQHSFVSHVPLPDERLFEMHHPSYPAYQSISTRLTNCCVSPSRHFAEK